MNQKRLLFILITFLGIVIIGVVLASRQSTKVLPIPGELSNNGDDQPQLSEGLSPSFSPPAEDTLTISDVRVNNFYKTEVNRFGGNVVFAETSDYQLTYVYIEALFIISVHRSPFEEGRQRAEKQFLSVLGLSQEEACRLNVSIETPQEVNFEESQKLYGLSFCQ